MQWTTRTATSIGLRWNPASDNVGVTGYRIYRNGRRVATVTATSYTVTGLRCGTTHTIGLTAVDAAGNESNRAEATGTTRTSACGRSSTPRPASTPRIPSATSAQAPRILSATLSSKRICARRAARCRTRAATLRLLVSKDARIEVRIRRAGGSRRLVRRIRSEAITGAGDVTIKSRLLARGRYRITTVATDDAGRRSAPVHHTITVR
jgi:chitodextrinase